jgi:DUF1680 family protein
MKRTFRTGLVMVIVWVVLGLIGCQTEQRCDGRSAVPDKVQPKVAFKARAFELSQVRLLDGPFKDAMERDRKYLLQLEPDRFLHTFRLNAGLPSTAKPYGGWEAPNIELRGHSIGHYLSGCALMYAGIGDVELKRRADYIVAELAKCQKGLGKSGYLSAYPEQFIDRVIAGRPVWAPWYTLHKIMAGLLDVYTYCGNKQALDVVCGMADWAKMRTDKLDDSQMQKMMSNEFGGMGEVLANLYAATGRAEYLALAQRFDHKRIFDSLAEKRDALQGLHANTQIPKVIAAAREYEETGDKKYETIATFFWDTVIGGRMYSIGGTSNYEQWRTPPGKLAAELSVESAETCCTYNMLKLTRHLFEWSPEARYADYYERAILNQILASQSPENGMVMYYIAMKPGHFKVFCQPEDSFWCCTGTGMENHAKYGDSIYFYDEQGLYVNLFIASELNWEQRGLVITQETKFPEEDKTSLVIKVKKPVELAIKVRVPYWATKGVKVSINGKAEDVKAEPKSYLVLKRTWKDGDRIDIVMPMSLHLHQMPDDAKVATIMYGPVVLAGELGTEKLTREMQYVSDQRSEHRAPSIDVPDLVGDPNNLQSWIKPVEGKALEYQTVGAGRPMDVTLVPFYKLYGQRYNIYWNLMTEQEYKDKKERLRVEKERQDAKRAAREKLIAESRVDEVLIGDAQSERLHNQQGSNTFRGTHQERNWRDAREGGFFSYDMKVLPDVPMRLECTYWGGNAGREFEVLVNDSQIASVTISEGHTEQFFTEGYRIPAYLTKDRDKVMVKFKAPADGFAGGVFGLMMCKDKSPQ